MCLGRVGDEDKLLQSLLGSLDMGQPKSVHDLVGCRLLFVFQCVICYQWAVSELQVKSNPVHRLTEADFFPCDATDITECMSALLRSGCILLARSSRSCMSGT